MVCMVETEMAAKQFAKAAQKKSLQGEEGQISVTEMMETRM